MRKHKYVELQGVVSKLKEDVLSVFPEGEIFTQEDLKLTNGEWPSLEEMLKEGHRLLLVSATDYGKAMAPLIFPRGKAVCRWEEPSLNAVRGVPQCTLLDRKKQHKGIFNGELMRVSTCELEYGPLNCDFIWDQGNAPFFDESTLPDVIDCGLNLPAPDLLTPSRAAASVWTWAPGHPQKNVGECAMISASDGRWRSMPCDTADVLPSTCRKRDVPITNDNQWVINVSSTLQDRGNCPEGSYFDMPRHARENYHLAMSLLHAGVAGAWLPAGSRLNIV